jgi:hypothetical protein
MDFRIGGQFFSNVRVPVLWGSRAILRDQHGHLSVVKLDGESPSLEVVDDRPAAGALVSPTNEGYMILDRDGSELYAVSPKTKSLTPVALRLPAVTLGEHELRLGPLVFEVNMVGVEVGIVVTESGIQLGGVLPPLLSRVRV